MSFFNEYNAEIEHLNKYQIEKLSPQPQVREALGLLKAKPLPLRPPLYSKTVPAKYKKLFLLTAILMP